VAYGFLDNVIGGSVATVAGIAALALIAFALIYILGEAEGRRTGTRDPALGVKIATAMLATIAFQMALLGLTALLTGAFLGAGRFVSKPAGGMLLGALVAGVLPVSIYLTRLRTRGGYPVGRKAIGLNAIVAGIVFTVVTISFVTMVVSGAEVDGFIAAWLIYGATTVTTLIYLVPPQGVQENA